MKVLVKGGIWKNTEDEILKAAVSKYGKNQWARISSLLVRKTPKQCKARWYEWLDPSIKKTEWSKEEDEKLLHLAKLMPTQWRTIAPIVGRTPAQCLERYQRLLDEAEAKEGGAGDEFGLMGQMGSESGPSADDVRRLRPGEVDPEPETKPARPDPVDMDEDEKEMLSEARARLANTQGKKAKRKARERQLEEARRLASLQKRRELKAAGIHIRIKRKKGDMDYNADIPFEKQVPLGFYDVTEEKNRPIDPVKLTNVHLSKLNRRRADIEEEKQREKKRKQKEAAKKGQQPEGNQGLFVRAKDQKILKAQEQEQIAKRRKLILPSPQVGAEELENIVKTGLSNESARSLVQDDEDISTPNQLLTPRTQTATVGGATPTPRSLMTPRTESIVGATPRPEMSKLEAKRELLQGLASLPVPRNEYEIRLPDLEKEKEKQQEESTQAVEDMSDVEKRNKELAKLEEEERLARRSRAVQKNLPRPAAVPSALKSEPASDIEAMLQDELLKLLKHDAIKYPVVGGKIAPGAVALGDLADLEDEFDSEALADARKELDMELCNILSLPEDADVKTAVWNHVSSSENFEEIWDKEHQEIMFSAKFSRFLTISEMPDDEDKIEGLSKMVESNRRAAIRGLTQAGKLENKLDVRLGGYMARSSTLSKQILDTYEELEAAKLEYDSFVTLQIAEKAAIPRRVDALQEEVDKLARRERELQEKYRRLTEEKNELIEVISQ